MLELLKRLIWRFAAKCYDLPLSVWIDFQWANLRFRETSHLLRLPDYLLKDMGLRRVGDRIEVIDPSRLDTERAARFGRSRRRSPRRKLREAS